MFRVFILAVVLVAILSGRRIEANFINESSNYSYTDTALGNSFAYGPSPGSYGHQGSLPGVIPLTYQTSYEAGYTGTPNLSDVSQTLSFTVGGGPGSFNVNASNTGIAPADTSNLSNYFKSLIFASSSNTISYHLAAGDTIRFQISAIIRVSVSKVGGKSCRTGILDASPGNR